MNAKSYYSVVLSIDTPDFAEARRIKAEIEARLPGSVAERPEIFAVEHIEQRRLIDRSTVTS
jgi:hypothetical protein